MSPFNTKNLEVEPTEEPTAEPKYKSEVLVEDTSPCFSVSQMRTRNRM